MRPSGRATDQLRAGILETERNKYAEGSCLANFGDTHVLCTAASRIGTALAAQQRQGLGHRRIRHAAARHRHAAWTARRRDGKQSGRTQEIQRLIGRSPARRRPT